MFFLYIYDSTDSIVVSMHAWSPVSSLIHQKVQPENGKDQPLMISHKAASTLYHQRIHFLLDNALTLLSLSLAVVNSSLKSYKRPNLYFKKNLFSAMVDLFKVLNE